MRGIRLVHTADWHLGHALHGHGREVEHRAFLDWLVELCADRAVDVLLIAGDVFDRAHPSAAATSEWFRFLDRLYERTADPHPTQVVAIAGNHDSPARLTAPAPPLLRSGVHLIGSVPRGADGSLDAEGLVVPLRSREDGAVRAHALAVPFLRPSDLRAVDRVSGGRPDGEEAGSEPTEAGAAERNGTAHAPVQDTARDEAIDPEGGVRFLYQAALAAARARDAALPVVALGHAHLVGCDVSLLSERPILLGGEEALSVGAFPDGIAYTALGHLHRAQRVGGRETVRYSGSPIPLSMAEADYRHQVVVVDLPCGPGFVLGEGQEAIGQGAKHLEVVPVPRAVDVLRIPPRGPGGVDEVEAALRALPPRATENGDEDRESWPFVEARVALREPVHDLKARLDACVADRAVRLVRITTTTVGGDGAALGERPGEGDRSLTDLEPREVFVRRWQRDFEGEPPAALLDAFGALCARAADEEEPA
jgi:exonuclease SbcD